MNNDTALFYANIITVGDNNSHKINGYRITFYIELSDTTFNNFYIHDNVLYFNFGRLQLYPVHNLRNFPLKANSYEYYRTLKIEEYNRVWDFIINNKPKWMTNETFSQLILKYGISIK
jgi:hypothetical protein